MKINFSPQSIKMLNDLVRDPFRTEVNEGRIQDPKTDEIKNIHRNQILEQGRTNFDETNSNISGKQKVLLYCFYYLQMHFTHNLCYFLHIKDKLFNYFIKDKNLIFIDFGCGPLTSAIPLNGLCKSNEIPLMMNYLGVDSSKNMLDKAQEFERYPDLFNENQKFHYSTDFASIKSSVSKIVEAVEGECHFILNFSYFFASKSLNVKDVAVLTQDLLMLYPKSNFCAVHQNPTRGDLNTKWDQYKQLVEPMKQAEGYPIIIPYSYEDKMGSAKWPEPKLNVFCDLLLKTE